MKEYLSRFGSLGLLGLGICFVGIVVCVLLYLVAGSTGTGPLPGWPNAASPRRSMLQELFKFALTTVVVGGAALVYNAFRRNADQRQHEAEQARRKREDINERNRVAREQRTARERASQALKAQNARAAQEAAAQRARDADTARRRLLEAFYKDFTQSYNDIKFIRRELRNLLEKQVGGEFAVEVQRYSTLMSRLNRSQLALEYFRRVMEAKPEYLRPIDDRVTKKLSGAEKYLRKVTAEYERHELNHIEDRSGFLQVAKGTRLFHFAAPWEYGRLDDSIHNDFFDPLGDVFDALSQYIEGGAPSKAAS